MPPVDQPKSKGGFALGDYIEVKDRVWLFYKRYPDGRLVTDSAWVSVDDDVPRVWVRAFAYRTPDDPHPGVGYSWMELPGKTPYTKGSELENTETSAWGRAIGATGIGLDKSIASADEIRGKEEPAPALVRAATPESMQQRPELERRADGLIGVATKGSDPADLGLRWDPDGTGYWGFKLKAGKTGYQAFATGQLAETLNTANLVDSIEGQNVTVWGKVEMVPWRKGDREMPPYARIIIEKLQTPDWILPAPADTMTVPMFDEPSEEEQIAIIAAELSEAEGGTGR